MNRAQSGSKPIDLRKLGSIVADHRTDNDRHLVLNGRRSRHRLWLRQRDLTISPVFLMPGDASFGVRSSATERLYRLIAGLRSLRRPPGIIPTDYQRTRFIQLLRLLDAEEDGWARREIAYRILYPRDPIPNNSVWKASHERRRMYRMFEDAHRLCSTGYRSLLQGLKT